MNNVRISTEALEKIDALPRFEPEIGQSTTDLISVPHVAREDLEQIAEGVVYSQVVSHCITVELAKVKVPVKRLVQIANQHMAVSSQVMDKTRLHQLGDTVLVTSSFMDREQADKYVEAIRSL